MTESHKAVESIMKSKPNNRNVVVTTGQLFSLYEMGAAHEREHGLVYNTAQSVVAAQKFELDEVHSRLLAITELLEKVPGFVNQHGAEGHFINSLAMKRLINLARDKTSISDQPEDEE